MLAFDPEIQGEINQRIKRSDATLVQSRVCLIAPIFTSARMWLSSGGQDALARERHSTPMISLDRLSCVRGANLEETLGEDSPLATGMPATPATEVQPEDIGML